MHKLKSHPNLNPNRNHKQQQRRRQRQRQRQRQQEKRDLLVVLRVCLWFIYLFITSFDWLLPVPPFLPSSLRPLSSSPAPTHACRLKLNSCIMNKFIVVGFRVSIYLVATLRGLFAHKLGPKTPVPSSHQPQCQCQSQLRPNLDCLWLWGLVKNKNNNESKKCVLISVSCSWQIILPHFICIKPDRREAKGGGGRRTESASFRKSHFIRITEYFTILSANSDLTFGLVLMRHCLMDNGNTLHSVLGNFGKFNRLGYHHSCENSWWLRYYSKQLSQRTRLLTKTSFKRTPLLGGHLS